MTKRLNVLLFLFLVLACTNAQAEPFTYNPPGQLVPNSGTGRVDDKVYVPGMRFPIEAAPAYPNSQVYGVGGLNGPSGGQCDTRNYSYPWSDNYCEKRSWDVPLCPGGGKGHQGQDIRPSTCKKDLHWVVSAEAGKVTQIGTYSVYVVSDNGTRHRYLHMEPSSLQVRVNDTVQKGQRLGRVSNAFGGTPTSIHLHYDIYQTVSGIGPTYVPTYMSLVRSYEALLGMPAEPCDTIDGAGATIDDKSPCFNLLGSLQYWRTVNDEGFDSRLYWTYAFTNNNPSAWATWSLVFDEAGQYDLEVYVEAGYNESKQARYVVRHEGQEDEIRLDMSTKSGWHPLGTWRFAKGDGQSLSLYDNTGEATNLKRKMAADAIRLTRVDRPMPDMGMMDMTGMDMSDDMAQEDMSQPPDMTVDMASDMSNDQGMTPADMQKPSNKGKTMTTSSSTCYSVPTDGPPRAPMGLLVILGGLWLGRRRR